MIIHNFVTGTRLFCVSSGHFMSQETRNNSYFRVIIIRIVHKLSYQLKVSGYCVCALWFFFASSYVFVLVSVAVCSP